MWSMLCNESKERYFLKKLKKCRQKKNDRYYTVDLDIGLRNDKNKKDSIAYKKKKNKLKNFAKRFKQIFKKIIS